MKYRIDFWYTDGSGSATEFENTIQESRKHIPGNYEKVAVNKTDGVKHITISEVNGTEINPIEYYAEID